MTKKEKLGQILLDFALKQAGDFNIEDITALEAKVSKKNIIDMLNTSGLFFTKDSKTFTPRSVYFKNARFIIFPSKEEVAQGVLIPGHRFIPFVNLNINPWDCTLTDSNGEKTPNNIITETYGRLSPYFSLFGAGNMENYLIRDRAENINVLNFNNLSSQRDTIQLSLTVFDCSNLYNKWNFAYKDGIMCEVKNWFEGIYTLKHITYKERRDLMDASITWKSKLEKGFDKVFDNLDINIRIEDQIAYAYYYADREILENPHIHLEGFFELSNKVFRVPFGVETKLWREKELPMFQLFESDELPPKRRGLDGIMERFNSLCTENEMEAFIRDELFRRKGMFTADQDMFFFDSIMKRIFGSDTEVSNEDLLKYFQKMWKKISKSYNYFSDQVSGKARNAVLLILEDYYGWFRNLTEIDANLQEMPVQSLTSMAQMYHTLTDYLKLLNQYDKSDQDQVIQLMDFIPAINSTLEMLRQSVLEYVQESRISSVKETKLKLVRPSSDQKSEKRKSSSIFVLKIILSDTDPFIWRSIQVPGFFTLGDLHNVIQTAMGWTNSHLHDFLINDVYYESASEIEKDGLNPDSEDEDKYTLDSLDLKEHQTFFYCYDFGDDWDHEIIVSKIVSADDFPEKEWNIPKCLGGAHACPPENCGGAMGYEEILIILKSGNERERQKLREFLDEGFDPAYFDKDEVNRLLQIYRKDRKGKKI